ncbi:hypothetical protein RF11_02360 [Thelohanellus kitauei]|uniref:Uncharacterized protein n=1 Tax=Thelohanellus kitauei TaxID=669202 RepID=A0A0C2MT69_THEKT|nr:hypothetical protein RF11_02360 [Thelohanellus kitauei]
MLNHLQTVFVSILFFRNLSKTNADDSNVQMTSRLAIDVVRCLSEKIHLCDVHSARHYFDECVNSSLKVGEQISDEYLKDLFNNFKAQINNAHIWYKEVSAEISRRLRQNVLIINDIYANWNELTTSIASRRSIQDHEYFLLFCSLETVAGGLLNILEAIKYGYTSMISWDTNQKKGYKDLANTSKTRALLYKNHIETRLNEYFNFDRENAESGLIGLLEPVLNKELAQDEISMTIKKFVVVYTTALVDTFKDQQMDDVYKIISLENDPILKCLNKDEPNPQNKAQESASPSNKSSKKTRDVIFYVIMLAWSLFWSHSPSD